MMSWIRGDYNFAVRTVVLVVGERDVVEVFGLVRDLADTPEKLADKLREIIDRCRPDLAGASIWSMNFCLQKRAWEILVEHPSLPIRELYERANEQMLRLDDVLPARDIKKLSDTTLKDYIKVDKATTVN